MAATGRLEVRVRSELKARIEEAAALTDVPVSDFVRSAVETRVDQVLREHEHRTRVPASFFDDLIQALDAPARPNQALEGAAERARDVVVRD